MIKLPENFNLLITIKKAAANGAATVFFLRLFEITTDPIALGAGFVFGLLGGSVLDIVGWLGNREAIELYNKKENS